MNEKYKVGEVAWGDVSVETSTGLFLTFKEGENRIRIVSKPYSYMVHWIEDATGTNRRVNCAMEGCPACADGNNPRQKYMIRVIDRETDEVKVVDAGVQIVGQLKALVDDPEWGKLSDYDVKVIRGKKNTQPLYTVNPCPKKALTADEKAKIKEAIPNTDLAKLSTPSTAEEVKAVLEGTVEDESDDEFDDVEPTKKEKTKKGKTGREIEETESDDDDDFLNL